MAAKLILIRHGKTDYSNQRKYCGVTDIDLNQEGRKQAEETAVCLANKNISSVYSSVLKRAVNFAKIIFKDTCLKIEMLPDLREMNFGIFEGHTYQEIMREYPDIYQKWLNNPSGIIIPNGESLNDMALRVRKILTQILTISKDRTIAVVTHSGPIKVILCNVLNLNLDEIWQIEPGLGSIREIEFDETKKGKILWES